MALLCMYNVMQKTNKKKKNPWIVLNASTYFYGIWIEGLTWKTTFRVRQEKKVMFQEVQEILFGNHIYRNDSTSWTSNKTGRVLVWIYWSSKETERGFFFITQSKKWVCVKKIRTTTARCETLRNTLRARSGGRVGGGDDVSGQWCEIK
jgi:hypothetical protein